VFAAVLVGWWTPHGFAQPVPQAPTPATTSTDDLAKPADPTAGAAPAGAAGADDLSRAADATADAAAVGTGAEPAKPWPAPDDGIDLSALGLDATGTASFDDKLNIYGFADLGYVSQHFVRDPVVLRQDSRGFSLGNLNVYLARNLTHRARALAEVRFTFLPNGSQNANGTYTDTTVQDIALFNRPTRWGGIVIERAYAEYDLTDHLTIRCGRWLTPYGIWNTDHGSPVIIATSRPYIIDQEFFPEHQTGLDLFGNHYQDGFKLDFHLTASNGRGATDETLDQDNKLAFGARIGVETPWGLKVGGSYYRGRYTGLPDTPGAPAPTYREAAYGGDVQLDHDGLHVQTEVMVHDSHYATASPATATAPALAADRRDFGYYVLAGYRFERLWNVMPYGYYQHYAPADGTLSRSGYESVNGQAAGLNLRPTGSLVVKLQALRGAFSEGQGLLAGQRAYIFAAQVSWVF
jgi:hypothetical protein